MNANILLCLTALLPMAARAQNDSTEVGLERAAAFNDSIIHSLPEQIVRGEKPVVKADGGKLIFDIGKLTSMTRRQVIALLKSIPAGRVANADVMYAAPARYQVRGALINVVLGKEKSKELSLQGELFGKAEVRHEAHFNERASLIMGKGIWSVDAFYDVTHGRGFHKMDKDGVHTLGDGTRHDINTRERINKADRPASGNLDLNLRYAFAHGNAVVNLYCNDIFQTMMITPECRWAGQNLRTKFSCYRTVGISFTYKFGGYKERKREKVDTERLKK